MSSLLLEVKKFFIWSLLSEKSLFFHLNCQLGQKRDIQCQERLYVCDEESSSQATQWVEFFSKGAFQLLWTNSINNFIDFPCFTCCDRFLNTKISFLHIPLLTEVCRKLISFLICEVSKLIFFTCEENWLSTHFPNKWKSLISNVLCTKFLLTVACFTKLFQPVYGQFGQSNMHMTSQERIKSTKAKE